MRKYPEHLWKIYSSLGYYHFEKPTTKILEATDQTRWKEAFKDTFNDTFKDTFRTDIFYNPFPLVWVSSATLDKTAHIFKVYRSYSLPPIWVTVTNILKHLHVALWPNSNSVINLYPPPLPLLSLFREKHENYNENQVWPKNLKKRSIIPWMLNPFHQS